MIPIEILIFPHSSDASRICQPIHRYTSSTWTIRLDALSDQTSEFELYTNLKIDLKEGERILVRYIHYLDWSYDSLNNMIFYGYVESYIENKITARDYRSLMKTNVPAIPKSEKDSSLSDPINFIYMGIERYVKPWNFFANTVLLEKSGETINWTYSNTEWKEVDFSETIRKIFKQYQVLINVNYYNQQIYNGNTMFNTYMPRMTIGRNQTSKTTILTEYTVPDVLEVYKKPVGDYDYNVVQVINITNWNVTLVKTSDWTDDVWTRKTTVLYDPEANEGISAKEYGEQFLSEGKYDHEITLGITYDTLFTLGQIVEIIHEGESIESIVSGIEYNSENGYVIVKCGNVRTELEMLL